ncbi:hypothetical protein GJ496_011263 [Pomphorhynchus laevis]|nr:hypothetical protein GJ496_011263 [Pomphorhynchus laevis]
MNDKIEKAFNIVWSTDNSKKDINIDKVIKGPELTTLNSIEQLIESFETIGFQASKLHEATEIVSRMLEWKYDTPEIVEEIPSSGYEQRPRTGCTIFLSFTSNLMSSGLREIFRVLVMHNMVDCIVTTAGGVEEDFIKCLDNFKLGEFTLDGATLRKQGINRIGNILVNNRAYCKFQDWLVPILDKMKTEKQGWTPSELVSRLGHEINDERSVYYWAQKNKIPVFCPAITDGSIGDILYFHSYRNPPGLGMDILPDQVYLNNMAVHAIRSGMIILGGGVSKHQVCNANLMRNGAELTVYINTGLELDGSDSGASPDEAVSWGKIKTNTECRHVKVFCDATIAFPLLASKCFAPRLRKFLQN